jgi:hypothetical protein
MREDARDREAHGRFYAEVRFAPCSQSPFLAVRHGIETRYGNNLYRESFAAGCWAASEQPATFRLSHDGEDVGRVVAVVDHGAWHHASVVIEDGPLYERARERVVVGAAVSLDGRSFKPDQDDDLLRRPAPDGVAASHRASD